MIHFIDNWFKETKMPLDGLKIYLKIRHFV